MSQYAQSRDLYDPQTIRAFADIVQSREMLNLLIILTAADIRAVGPGVWTGWKGQLLRQLYYESEPLLTGGHTAVPRDMRIAQAIGQFREAAAAEADLDADAFFARQVPAYWLRTETASQLRHARLLQQAEQVRPRFASEIATDSFTALTQLTLWMEDAPASWRSSRAHARRRRPFVAPVFGTTRDGMSLHTLHLQRRLPNDSEEIDLTRRIVDQIHLTLTGQRDLYQMVSQKTRPRPQLQAFRVQPRVTIDNSLSEELTVVEANGRDRTGLLFDLSRICEPGRRHRFRPNRHFRREGCGRVLCNGYIAPEDHAGGDANAAAG